MRNRCFVVAEAGVNHNGSLDLARQLADVARAAGADAVKFQTFQAELLATESAETAAYQRADAEARTQREMLEDLSLSLDEFAALKDHCDGVGIEFLSTPFDEQSADFLNELGMRRFKV